jgi:hypothetical protein
MLPTVDLQGKDVPTIASNRWKDSSKRQKSLVDKGKLTNVKRVRHAKSTTVDDVKDSKNVAACLYLGKKKFGQNIYESAWPLFEQTYYMYLTV